MTSLEKLQRQITGCTRCARLTRYCHGIGITKKREFKDWEYWAKPVPSFGDPAAKIWIVGLAPAAHGANRTGRMFTGDSSGRWLYRALHKAGFANQAESVDRKDGLKLNNIYISAAAHCAPPDNKPLPSELSNCLPYLDQEYALLEDAWLFLALGKISFDTILKLLQRQGIQLPNPKPKFAHGAFYDFGEKTLLASYHPSRQNTQTGKLTEPMWDGIFETAKELLEDHAASKSKLVRPLRSNKLNVPGALGKS